MSKICLLAHAKANLTLDVLGRRPDGYHELESVMVPLSLADFLTLEKAPRISLSSEGPFAAGLPDPAADLASEAAALLKSWTGYAGGCAITMRKNIPLAAGLGGGSADAAAVLHGLNRLWDLKLERQELLNLAARLGSDVPFCLLDRPAVARGRGEILEMIPAAALDLVLVKPPVPKSTGAVYRKLNPDRMGNRPDNQAVVRALALGRPGALTAAIGNVLTPIMSGDHPEIGRAAQTLLDCGALAAGMTGAGPTVFAIAENRSKAKEIVALAGRRLEGCEIMEVQTLPSPRSLSG